MTQQWRHIEKFEVRSARDGGSPSTSDDDCDADADAAWVQFHAPAGTRAPRLRTSEATRREAKKRVMKQLRVEHSKVVRRLSQCSPEKRNSDVRARVQHLFEEIAEMSEVTQDKFVVRTAIIAALDQTVECTLGPMRGHHERDVLKGVLRHLL